MAGKDSSESELARLCAACATATNSTGTSIMLMWDDTPPVSLCATDSVGALIAESQFALGEGPCLDAHGLNRPVLEPDLAGSGRWPGFTGPALDAGVEATFSFPVRLGTVRLGTLNLYRNRPGDLSDEDHATALVAADVVARAILMMQADAPAGRLATQLDSGVDYHYLVHQAAGMVAAQLEVNLGNALVRLRAFSFANDRPLLEVAGDVVARRLRFDD